MGPVDLLRVEPNIPFKGVPGQLIVLMITAPYQDFESAAGEKLPGFGDGAFRLFSKSPLVFQISPGLQLPTDIIEILFQFCTA